MRQKGILQISNPIDNVLLTVTGKSAQITDLTGYTWAGNGEIPDIIPGTYSDYKTPGFDLKTIHRGNEYNYFKTYTLDGTSIHLSVAQFNGTSVTPDDSNAVYVYWAAGWSDYSDGDNIIQITGGTDVTNPTLINWLQANGTLTRTN